MLTTDHKGAIAEAAIAHAAIKLGIGVYKPMVAGGRYDLIPEAGSRLLRTRCKWSPLHGGVVVVRSYSARRARDGLRWRGYTRAESIASPPIVSVSIGASCCRRSDSTDAYRFTSVSAQP